MLQEQPCILAPFILGIPVNFFRILTRGSYFFKAEQERMRWPAATGCVCAYVVYLCMYMCACAGKALQTFDTQVWHG